MLCCAVPCCAVCHVCHSRTRMKDTQFSSKAYGTHEYKDLTIEGRIQFDLYMALQRDHKLSSYSLNAVSMWGPGFRVLG